MISLKRNLAIFIITLAKVPVLHWWNVMLILFWGDNKYWGALGYPYARNLIPWKYKWYKCNKNPSHIWKGHPPKDLIKHFFHMPEVDHEVENDWGGKGSVTGFELLVLYAQCNSKLHQTRFFRKEGNTDTIEQDAGEI